MNYRELIMDFMNSRLYEIGLVVSFTTTAVVVLGMFVFVKILEWVKF